MIVNIVLFGNVMYTVQDIVCNSPAMEYKTGEPELWQVYKSRFDEGDFHSQKISVKYLSK